MKNNALVLLWKGEELPDYLVKKIAEILITNGICIPEMLTIKVKDEEAVACALLRDANNNDTVVVDKPNVAEAVKQAIVYIGKRFEDLLKDAKSSGDYLLFALDLSNAVTIAQRNISFVGVGSNDELLTAVDILATTPAVIPATLAKKYYINNRVIDVIKQVYKSH